MKYNQKDVISEIHKRTGCSTSEISTILNTLGDVVKHKLSNDSHYVEIKLFPGLKITADYISPEQSKSNLPLSQFGFVLRLHADLSDYFKKEVRNLHHAIENNLQSG